MQNPSRPIYSVSEVNDLLRAHIENEAVFSLMLVRGEIVNYKRHSSGHLYFSLKDEDARVRCVMFRTQSRTLEFRPENGSQVLIQGRLSVYSRSGEYQIYVDAMYPMGRGNLHQRFLELKERLGKEGLFEPELKQALPAYPLRIGVVTSPTGAAIHDIRETVRRRFPAAQVVLKPVRVQGDRAAAEIAAAVSEFNHENQVEVLIVGRGGGAPEELWAFNEEIVVLAVASSHIPIISAVGHEIDRTLCDLAADAVAATPTGAAVMAVPEMTTLLRDLDYAADAMNVRLEQLIRRYRQAAEDLERRLGALSPQSRLRRRAEQLDFLEDKLKYSSERLIRSYRMRLSELRMQLAALEPRKPLSRGFALVHREADGSLVRSVGQAVAGERMRIELHDGSFRALVLEDDCDRKAARASDAAERGQK